MHKNEKLIQLITGQGVLPLYFHPDETISILILQALYEAGIRIVEYTNRGQEALKNFKQMKKISRVKFPDMILGMGTITDKKSGLKALEAGAEFLISPGYSEELCRLAEDEKIFWIPGCMTPSDLIVAKKAGLRLVKIFPANVLGIGFVKAVKEVFPDLLFMPTGGVDPDNLERWFGAGVSAVGLGGGLISKAILENRDFDLLKQHTSSVINQIASIRSAR
jgi:2-dehydro-3-deoxyphosphogluconate aldolase / (4S)-4-hydroxy-2-oxoglutarate aldolase